MSASRPLTRTRLRGQGWIAGLRQLANTIELGVGHGRFAPLGPLLNALFAVRDLLRGRRAGAPGLSRQDVSKPDPDSATPMFDGELARRRPAAIARFIVRRADRSQIVDRRRKNHQLLAESLAGVGGLSVLAPTLPDNAVPYVFPIWVEQPERSYHALRVAGVPVFRWDILWPGVRQMQGDVGLSWSHHVFQLGCHQDLSEADIRSIALIVRRIVGAVS